MQDARVGDTITVRGARASDAGALPGYAEAKPQVSTTRCTVMLSCECLKLSRGASSANA